MSDIDTATIRTKWLLTTHEGPKKLFEVFGDVAALCDALDAANARIAELEQRSVLAVMHDGIEAFKRAESIAADYRATIEEILHRAESGNAKGMLGTSMQGHVLNSIADQCLTALAKHEKGDGK